MAEPERPQLNPYQVELEAGRRYSWCRCGRSKKQPFCDGSHTGTGIEPLTFTAERTELALLCGCKDTGDPPYCDGSHLLLLSSPLQRIFRRCAGRGLLGKKGPVEGPALAVARRVQGGRGEMAYFLQQLINGIALGSIYGLIAIGYTMVYGIIGMINFAHGDIFMVGSFIALIAFLALVSLGLTFVPFALIIVLVIAMALTAVWGWTVERIAYRPLRESFRLAPPITAIGMSIVLQNFIQVSQGARVKPLQPVVTGGYELFVENGFEVNLSNIQILVVVTTFVLMAVFWLIITRTALGRAQRACEQDRLMASLSGVNVDRTISLTFVLGAALAAVAGLLYLLYYGVIDFYIGFVAGIKAFTAAVFGGIGSLPGAMLGGLIIGLIETFWSAYAPS